jgi:protein-disulfide isomerase
VTTVRALLADAATIACGICALGVTAIVVRNQFFRPPHAPARLSAPEQVKDWRRFGSPGHRIGPSDAPVTIIEFADFECPVCRTFSVGALSAVRVNHPNDVQVIFRHWPLNIHRLAYPAARAAECAGAQGHFAEYADLLYEKQDSLGLKPFDQFASDAGVRNLQAFRACNGAGGPVPAIDVDVAAAHELQATGTPTVIVNGLRYVGAPDSAALEKIVSDAIAKSRR